MNLQSEEEQSRKTLRCQSDFAFCHPAAYLTACCDVCGQSMSATRNVLGPTSFAEAMAVRFGPSDGHLHDEFGCNDRDETWHRQAKAIQIQARESASQRLSDLLTEEADELVRTRKHTKENFF